MRMRPLLLATVAALAALATALPAGAAKVPCWKLVLQDSYTGHFDTIYPHSCYKQAMERIPTTLLIYSDTRQEIQAAASAALNNRKYTARSVANAPAGTGKSASASTSGSSHGVPTAIIILGGVAVALLLIGGAGEAWRRTHRSDD